MIKAIITDFDGTLVDTFEANFLAYQRAFEDIGKSITREQYHQCFGYRFDSFMQAMGVDNERDVNLIKEAKRKYYPEYFHCLKKNAALIQLIACFHALGGKSAIVSTARKENLMNAVNYLGISQHFDHIFTGIDVKKGKPDPEIYFKAMDALNVSPESTLIFEDSQVGIEAAKASGANFLIVSPKQFE